jgi:hypothetical protein
MGAIVKFEWQATNADYVLIKGHDNRRHPLHGAIDRSHGGQYTFLAVAGTRAARLPKMCMQNFKRGAGIHGWIVSAKESPGNPREYFESAFVFSTMTSLSRTEIRDRISALLHREYGITTIFDDLDSADTFIYTAEPGFHATLCDKDQCKRNGKEIKRHVGFDIWIERGAESQGGRTYRFHIVTNVEFRAGPGDDDWQPEPAELPLVPVRLGNAIAQMFG